MKYSAITGLMVIGSLLSACDRPTPVDLQAERNALRAAAASYHAAARTLDIATLAGLYSDDARVLPPGAATVSGMAGVRDFVESFSATPGFSVSTDDTAMTVEVGAGGDMGYTLADVTLSVTGPDGAPVEEQFRDFHVWRKRDGDWKLAVDVWNSEAGSEAGGGSINEDRAAIDAISRSEMEAFTAGDRAAMNALFTDDALLLPPDEPAVEGAAARDAWLQALYSTFSVDGAYIDRSVEVAGDLAYETLVFRMTLMPLDGSEPIVELGKGLHIYTRQPDGSWKIAVDVWNTDG